MDRKLWTRILLFLMIHEKNINNVWIAEILLEKRKKKKKMENEKEKKRSE